MSGTLGIVMTGRCDTTVGLVNPQLAGNILRTMLCYVASGDVCKGNKPSDPSPGKEETQRESNFENL